MKKLEIGLNHSAVITEDGRLFMFGNGNWGVLGQGNEQRARHDQPVLVEKFTQLGLKVVDVALGDCHTIALTDDGSVWTWGYGGKKGMFNWMYSQDVGALGHGDKEPSFVPKKVSFFEENGIEVQQVEAGLFHCNVLTKDNKLYTWGRGLYGVLGNGSNDYSLTPILNESVEGVKEESDPASTILRMASVDESSAVLMSNHQLNTWGKNDRGQLGVNPGIGIDMVESENMPTLVDLKDENEVPQSVKDFAIGQNTMLIRDHNDDLYQVGLRLHYEPKKLNFDEQVLDKSTVKMLACGRKHYIIVTESNDMLIWGNVVNEKSSTNSEGGL